MHTQWLLKILGVLAFVMLPGAAAAQEADDPDMYAEPVYDANSYAGSYELASDTQPAEETDANSPVPSIEEPESSSVEDDADEDDDKYRVYYSDRPLAYIEMAAPADYYPDIYETIRETELRVREFQGIDPNTLTVAQMWAERYRFRADVNDLTVGKVVRTFVRVEDVVPADAGRLWQFFRPEVPSSRRYIVEAVVSGSCVPADYGRLADEVGGRRLAIATMVADTQFIDDKYRDYEARVRDRLLESGSVRLDDCVHPIHLAYTDDPLRYVKGEIYELVIVLGDIKSWVRATARADDSTGEVVVIHDRVEYVGRIIGPFEWQQFDTPIDPAEHDASQEDVGQPERTVWFMPILRDIGDCYLYFLQPVDDQDVMLTSYQEVQ